MNCYNGETYLSESIQSVLSQTYKNWELIFWDNKSTDKSAKIFKGFSDSRLKYYQASEHTVLYKARNEAIKKSSGEFIAFLDTDDLWEKSKLELQMPLFDDLKTGVVYGDFFLINEQLNTKKIFLKGKKPKGYILNSLLKNYCTGLPTIVIRKKFLNINQGAFDETFNIIGDFDLMIRMSAKHKFDYISKPVASYRIHGNNESLKKKDNQIEELKIWCNKIKKYPDIFNNKNFIYINKKINNLEIVNLFLENDLSKVRLKIKKMPISFKKIKYIMALFLPYSFIKKFIQF